MAYYSILGVRIARYGNEAAFKIENLNNYLKYNNLSMIKDDEYYYIGKILSHDNINFLNTKELVITDLENIKNKINSIFLNPDISNICLEFKNLSLYTTSVYTTSI